MNGDFEKVLNESFRDINRSIQSELDPEYHQGTYDEIEFIFFDGNDYKTLFNIPQISKATALTIGWAYFRDDIYTSMPCSDFWLEIMIEGKAFAIVNCYDLFIGEIEVAEFYKENNDN